MRRHHKTSTAKHRPPAPDEVNRVAQQHTIEMVGHTGTAHFLTVDAVDHGLTGTHRHQPGLREAMAACRAGDLRAGGRRRVLPALLEAYRTGAGVPLHRLRRRDP